MIPEVFHVASQVFPEKHTAWSTQIREDPCGANIGLRLLMVPVIKCDKEINTYPELPKTRATPPGSHQGAKISPDCTLRRKYAQGAWSTSIIVTTCDATRDSSCIVLIQLWQSGCSLVWTVPGFVE